MKAVGPEFRLLGKGGPKPGRYNGGTEFKRVEGFDLRFCGSPQAQFSFFEQNASTSNASGKLGKK